jgi:hypothetical protein
MHNTRSVHSHDSLVAAVAFDIFEPHCVLDTRTTPCTCVVCPTCNGAGVRTFPKGFRTLCPTCDASGSLTQTEFLLLLDASPATLAQVLR